MLRVRDKDMLLHVHDHQDPCHRIPKSSRYGDVSATVSCLYFLKVSIYYSGSVRQSPLLTAALENVTSLECYLFFGFIQLS